LKDRIKEIRKLSPYGKTQETFSNYLGIPKQNLSSYEIGRRTPSDAVVQLICQKCKINEEWLRTGKGEPQKDADINFGEICADIGENDPMARQIIEKYHSLTQEDKELLWKFIEKFMK